MSIESDFRGWLTGAAGVTALVPAASIAQNEVAEGIAPPYIAFEIQRVPDYGLDNTLLSTQITASIGCWATAPGSADTIADAVTTALAAEGLVITQRGSTFNPETGLDGTTLVAEWFL